jgi:hypothetical protein
MLELNGCHTFINMGKATGPAQPEFLLPGIFLPLRKLLDIMDRFAPEIRGEVFDHAMDGFCRCHDVLPEFLPENGIPCVIIYSSCRMNFTLIEPEEFENIRIFEHVLRIADDLPFIRKGFHSFFLSLLRASRS